MGFWIFPYYVESGSSWTILTWRCGLDFTILQGTKVLKDHEIRRSFNVTTQGNPPRHTSPRISKYTGDLVSPKWVDIEPGRVFIFPWHLMKSSQSPKDNFETLCYVKADISSASCTPHYSQTRGMGYRRNYDIILLVGLTEFKAQVCWIDSETVRAHLLYTCPFISSDFEMCESRERRRGL